VDAPKLPVGALFWRNAGKYHLANYKLKPEIATDGSWRRMAYAPLEYGYKVSICNVSPPLKNLHKNLHIQTDQK
jgi:hypothetical protein